MKYIEAKKQIEALSSKYSVATYGDFEYFNVNYKGSEIAYVSTEKPYFTRVWSEYRFKQMPFSNKLYMILSELAITQLDERVEEKHYVKVYDSVIGYLNINTFNGKMSMNDVSEGAGYKTKFTDKEIEQLKQREDIPLDWNKVILEETNEY